VADASLRDFLEYLYKQRDIDVERQKHAETMAWAGVAVYVAAIAAFISVLKHPSGTLWLFRTGVEVALVLALLIALGYTRRQFNAREWSCRLVASYSRLISLVLEGDRNLDHSVRDFVEEGPLEIVPSHERLSPSGPPHPTTGHRITELSRSAVALITPRRESSDQEAPEEYPVLVRRFLPDTCPGSSSMEYLAYAVLALTFVIASVYAMTLAPNRTSTITSPPSATFGVGVPGSFEVVASGDPVPRITESGPLPDGVTFADNRNGTATLSGVPTQGAAGQYQLEFTATNGVSPSAVQNFSLAVVGTGVGPRFRAGGTGPQASGAFTSANRATASRDYPFTFVVTTTGTGVPKIRETGHLPRGVVFHNNGNGTAMLSGVPHPRHPGVYDVTFKAIFGRGRTKQAVVQGFTLTVS
jgi:hypothetical protein